MVSSLPSCNNGHNQYFPNQEEIIPYLTPIFPLPIRRTTSFSSSSPSHSSDSSLESFSLNDEFSPFRPITKVPFSWEEIPGIPKFQDFKKKDFPGQLLPLPPAGNTNCSAKKSHNQKEISPKKHHNSNRCKDPFFAALVECSKDDDKGYGTNFGHIWRGSSKLTRSLSDKFGFKSMYTSCKTTCATSESIVYLPRSKPRYDLLNGRRSS